uniref:Importin N-terminal domain-containing protein n=1 Tax=Panagrellus redivivus TaxID=6233 RepID=A0A7E4VNR2_PANRE
MAMLLVYLERTVISQDANEQRQALDFLQQAAEQNYAEFARQLSEVLAASEAADHVRQAAGLQLKNILFAKEAATAESNKRRWLETSIDIRNVVKQKVLAALSTEVARPSIAAQCINAIAGIELPFGQWAEVIDILMTNVTSPTSNERLRDSSLAALGYICQDINAPAVEEKSNAILTAIVHGMRNDEPSILVRQTATTAMLNALELTRNNFANVDERNVIMKVVCETTQANDEALRVLALQCLVKIVSLYYNYMDAYMKDALFSITVAAMRSPVDDVALQGIEFWSNICEEELCLFYQEQEAREEGRAPAVVSRYYAKGALQHILPLLLDTLAKQNDSEDDDDWIPAKAAGVCIMLLAQCTKDDIVRLILPFIQQHFQSTDWHFREAAIMAFGSILEGPSQIVLNELVEGALMPLISTLSDSHLSIRDTAAWTISRVCDACENLVTRPIVLETLVPALFNCLTHEPRVAANACWALSSLVKAAYQNAREQGTDDNGEPDSYVLTPVFPAMVAKLIATTDRPDAKEARLRIAGYEALMELIKNSPKDCYVHVRQTTVDVLTRLQQVLSLEDNLMSASDREQLRDLQSLLCATLQSVLRKIHKNDAAEIAEPIMTALMQVISRCSTVRDSEGVLADALFAVSVLIEVSGEGFARFMDVFKPYLIGALQNHEDHLVCQAAIGVISDLCHSFKDKLAPLMDEFVALLLKLLNDPNVKHEVKPHALGCFGDIALALGSHYVRYLEATVTYLMNAVEAAQITNPEDLEQVDYVESLRENCITGFTSIVQAMRDQPAGVQALSSFVPQMVTLITIVANSGNISSDEVQASAVGLVGDLIELFGQNIRSLVDTEPINGLLQRCRRSKSQRAKAVGTWASRELAHLKRSGAN